MGSAATLMRLAVLGFSLPGLLMHREEAEERAMMEKQKKYAHEEAKRYCTRPQSGGRPGTGRPQGATCLLGRFLNFVFSWLHKLQKITRFSRSFCNFCNFCNLVLTFRHFLFFLPRLHKLHKLQRATAIAPI